MLDQKIKKKDKFSTGLLGALSDAEFLRVDTHTHTHTHNEMKALVYPLCA